MRGLPHPAGRRGEGAEEATSTRPLLLLSLVAGQGEEEEKEEIEQENERQEIMSVPEFINEVP